MEREFQEAIAALIKRGWQVEFSAERNPLPQPIAARYPWMPAPLRDFFETVQVACNPGQTAWMLTSAEFAGMSGSAFAWNEWERESIEAADGDQEWIRGIRSFWDHHLPIAMTVKGPYAYFAVEQEQLSVVRGEEPEYEEPRPLAASLREFLEMLAKKDSALERWL